MYNAAMETPDYITSQPPTKSEQAKVFVLQQIENLPGILKVELHGGETLGEQEVHVFVSDKDYDTEMGVYDITGKAYEQFPNARLDVTVRLDRPE